MFKIFHFLNELSPFASKTLSFTLSVSFFILFVLIIYSFVGELDFKSLYIARYAICVSAAIFSEGLVFSCVIHKETKN